ncbi:beta-ketoacyl-[acyl-carrier-protein] synthase family protein [[Kitasatospora] papulosa]|uniref:Beta-ketoacyl-[acyl-carrier-protein] synthase family protein n=1 Tax=Streptomyces sp. Tue6314 TaxID=2602572 RepID=A0A5B9BQZ8_9ACTN|nr:MULTISPECIES: beta-ketoacyl-[acyl-carrier-protein] synthase family protein [Streptomyces]MDF9873509.1 act minimal PKS ketosynthase (KS/KS alpha) [Streptomyces pratensis]QED90637.1 beta-ketoacyl-[acyl-carrier-protein] synthase family protein [Streptomyces sp. Tue6314]RAS28255.1 act minimal PKS ketosynthase (KS/KS alpha) [Streptomyces avidinii]TPN00931.1 beta-ketoacyl-[acyl-carrier-protein] synthase family protein [Mesorhizobium sp. B2-3-3]SNX79548.1 act minimal PKS ketosynthase (KS/KS alpha)
MNRRVAVTGIGVVAPGGTGTKEFWSLITSGRTATGPLTAFDATPYRSRIAAQCAFDPLAAGFSAREVRRLDRAALFAVACAREALADAGLASGTSPVPERTGVSLGTAVGCTTSLENEYAVVSDGGRDWLVDHRHAVPQLVDYLVPSSLAREVAWAADALGPAAVISAGCTSGLDAVGHACEIIREGTADVMLTGGTDAPISPITVASFDAIRATSARNDDPATASRPFDRTRDGFVLGEGAAVLVLEEWSHAVGRGAHVYAEIGGHASRGNAYHMTGLRPDGREMAEAITRALDEARLDPTAVDYVNAHGSGTLQNDRHESAAFLRALGEHARGIPVSSIKSMIGHSLGAIGAIEIAACALALEHGVVPPTANLHEPDPDCPLDYVPVTAREQRLDAVLTVGSGFGGFQSAMVLTRPEGTRR